MSLDKVIEDILRKGEERSQELLLLGKKEADENLALADKKIAERRAGEERKTDTAIAQMEQQEVSSAELESKKALLGAQKQVMEDLREQILAELESYPADKRKKLYGRLSTKAKKELKECYVYTNSGDKPLVQLLPGMTYGGAIDCRGGVVFESKDRTYRLDYRFETMLDEVWNRSIQEIYSKLFR
jgi:V/A-type H+-transporting ATPase subunit E